jgi:S1-C subfamily serine protease
VRRGLAALALGAVLLAPALTCAAQAATAWGWLGVRIRDLSEQEMEDISKRFGMREGFGAVIVEVIKETPAAAAGLRNGDLVVAFRDRPVVDTRGLQRAVSSTEVGETVRLTVLRQDEGRRPVQVRVGRMPEAMAADRVAAEYGFLVRDPDGQPELGGARPSPVPSVAAVVPRTRAERAGLQVGDVLTEVAGRPVISIDAVREALLAAGPDGPLPLVLRRGQEQIQVTLDPASRRLAPGAARLPDRRPAHHPPAGLAARVDRDHRHLLPELHPAAEPPRRLRDARQIAPRARWRSWVWWGA